MKIIKKFWGLIPISFFIFLCVICVLISFGIGLLYTALSYHPEDVVIENGMKMVARDTSFLDFRMEYYEYKNILFRGKQVLKLISNRTYWIYNSNGELLETSEYDK